MVDLERMAAGPLHERLTRALRRGIRDGRPPLGSAMPPSRSLAADLGCSRWAVTEAYEQLIAEGYLQALVGSGTRVCWAGEALVGKRPASPGPKAVHLVDLAPGLPDLRAFPRRRWADALSVAASTATYGDLGHPQPRGHPRLRSVLAAYLDRVRATSTARAEVLVTRSVTSSLPFVLRALKGAGDAGLAVEDPGWTRLHTTLRTDGARTVAVPVDEEGLDVDQLRSTGCRAVLVTAAHHFPLGVVLSPRRRAELLRWAHDVDGYVLEDDYDSEFRYDRAPLGALQGMDPDRVVLLGSLSKTLSPALGVGWTVLPSALAATGSGWLAPTPGILEQAAFAAMLESGAYDRHLRLIRRGYRRRRDLLIAELGARLPDCAIGGAAAGLHLLLTLPHGVQAATVTARAVDRGGVRVAGLDSYCAHRGDLPQALVLGYGNVLDTDIAPAVANLTQVIDDLRGTEP